MDVLLDTHPFRTQFASKYIRLNIISHILFIVYPYSSALLCKQLERHTVEKILDYMSDAKSTNYDQSILTIFLSS